MAKIEKTVRFDDYDVYKSDRLMIEDVSRTTVINTLNQYSYCLGESSPEFKAALKGSDILLPDGVGVIAMTLLFKGIKLKKISGYDAHLTLLKWLNITHGRCFYLGSIDSTLQRIKNRILKEFPNVNVALYSPPFKTKLSATDNAEIFDRIRLHSPDVLFIGMTAPKQELWSFENKHSLNIKVICSIGAVFDFYAGVIKRPKKFWVRLGLEWFGRFLSEPKRMWKRYFYYGPIFFYLIISKKIIKFFS